MNKARIVDFYSIKTFHEMFNVSFILLCSEIYSEVDILLGRTTYENLLLLCNNNKISIPDNISFKISRVCEKDTKWGAFMRICMGSFKILKEYFLLSKTNTLILNYSNVFAYPFLLFINRFIKKKILVTFHGDLELLSKKQVQKNKISFWYSLIYKCSFKHLLSRSNVYILVLGASIKNSIVELYPQVKQNIISINHPYIFPDEDRILEVVDLMKNCDILTIGVLGALDEKRGLFQFLQLAEYFKKQIVAGKLVLKSIGKRPKDINVDKWNYIHWGTESAMSRNEFEKNVYSLDYILCLYPVDSYKFTASGVAMDALRFMKPIIALQNNYLRTITNGYKVGFEASTLDEIKEVIEAELHRKTEPMTFNVDLLKMRTFFGISYNAHLLKTSLLGKN